MSPKEQPEDKQEWPPFSKADGAWSEGEEHSPDIIEEMEGIESDLAASSAVERLCMDMLTGQRK